MNLNYFNSFSVRVLTAVAHFLINSLGHSTLTVKEKRSPLVTLKIDNCVLRVNPAKYSNKTV